ncbi:MAG: HAMP domain-containing protein [Dehalococcoidia bacterium]|nr:HAMP domain-containing protein [Dehalococcoidia bacterium]
MKARLRAVLELRNRLSTQLYAAIGSAVVLTVAASLVGWFSFNQVGEAQDRVNERSVPELVAAFGVAQEGGVLVVAAPRLTTATTTEELAGVSAEITDAYLALQEALDVLSQQSANSQAFERIQTEANALIENIREIETEKTETFDLQARNQNLRVRLQTLLEEIDKTLVPAVDDQLFFTITGFSSLDEPAAQRDDYFSEEQVSQYRHLADLLTDSGIAGSLLESAYSISEAPLLEPLRERFESSEGRIQSSLAAIDGTRVSRQVSPLANTLIVLGSGEEGIFALLDQELRLAASQRDLLAENRNISLELVTSVNSVVSAANLNAQEATRASTQAALTGRTLLLGISAISIGGALLIAWLFVGRVILRRLQMLSQWMRRMAGGDLEAQVEIGGRDEVADMAAALEVFRRHALEVQRLNLVEELAGELQGKNEQLESALGELEKAQDQIVMREKLAALGELTAGVAHEIRNPLNFVKNFSEVSEELLVELKEVLEESGDALSTDQKGIIEDISGDLSSNLERIGSHSERANRIVHDMLMMGRGSAEWQSTDINALLEEYARLAYHSARATDADFQLDLQNDLDPEAGELEIIPQDMGRVFLNVVGNACYATDQRRRSASEQGLSITEYMPTVKLSTKRTEDIVEVRIRDNGTGMPAEVAEKIFNPFFTTKPTGQGTGLGLALSNDIVREHGGTIQVESAPDEYTEMIIRLPIERYRENGSEEDGGSGEPEKEAADSLEPEMEATTSE